MRCFQFTLLCSALLAVVLPAQRASTSVGRTPLGGPATIADVSPNAFGFASPTLTGSERRAFVVGNALFKTNWVQAPASAAGRDGLGPLFNARSCSACHFKDGRGRPAHAGEHAVTGLLLRLGVQDAGAGLAALSQKLERESVDRHAPASPAARRNNMASPYEKNR